MRHAAAPKMQSLDRPKGYFPKGTSLGLIGLIALAVGVPFSVLACAAPITTGGFDRWLESMPYVLGFGLIASLTIVFSMRSRRYWSVCLFYYSGMALLVAYGLSSVFALVCVAGALPAREDNLGAMSIAGLVALALLGAPAWFLRRTLGLRYWQPGSAPQSWEKGDEGPPAWALSPARPPK